MNIKQMVREVKFHTNNSNKTLSEAIGVSEQTINTMSCGINNNPQFETILSIARLHPKGTAVLGEFE